MNLRNYGSYTTLRAASEIASEVVSMGLSTGWSGSLEELSLMEKTLAPFNIVYVDDLRGEWKLKR
jgi:hypothetical protein